MSKQALSRKDCALIRKKLSAFADGEVSSDWHLKIEAHLETCPDCQQALAELQRLWLELDDPMPVQTRPGFERDVMRKIAEEAHPVGFDWFRSLSRLFPVPATVAMVALVGMLLGGWMGHTLLDGVTNPLGATIAATQGQSATIEALDIFAPTPKGSLAHDYLMLAGDTSQVTQ
jgi:anti-sigma factor RsiW